MTRALLLVLAACATPAPPPAAVGSPFTPSKQPLPGLVRGRVIDREGRPVAGVVVATDRPPTKPDYLTNTNEHGAFALRFGEPYLSNGFELHAMKADVYASLPVVIPRKVKDHVVTITVLPAGRLHATIPGAKKAILAAQFGNGGYFFVPVSDEGTVSTSVPIGDYLVGDADRPEHLEPVTVTR